MSVNKTIHKCECDNLDKVIWDRINDAYYCAVCEGIVDYGTGVAIEESNYFKSKEYLDDPTHDENVYDWDY